jgi:hypothetical protein
MGSGQPAVQADITHIDVRSDDKHAYAGTKDILHM